MAITSNKLTIKNGTMKDLLNTTRAWTISLSSEGSLKKYILKHTIDNYACIQVLEQENNQGNYDIKSFECYKEMSDDDKRFFINLVVINLLLMDGKKKNIPFLYMKQSNDENLNFIKSYLSGWPSILQIL